MSNNDTVAAMRHLRSIVQSIAMDENISPTQRTQKIQNFEQLLDKAEKQLHYKKGAGGAGVCELLDDPLNIKSKQVVNAVVLKNKNKSNNNKKKNKEWKKKGWLKAGRLLGRQRAANKSSSVGGLCGGSVARLSTTYEGLEVDTRHETEVQRRDMALQDEETREETDSIIDIRDQNSYDYTASIESLRSLNTFEKDFINNVTAEHARMEAAAAVDGNSVGTFEQDFVGPVRNNYPTQVVQHQMYNDDAISETTFEADAKGQNDDISETTFEADARSLEPLENQAVVGNGGQGGGGSVFVPQMVQTTEHEEVEDDITVDTLENDERADNNVPPQQQQPNPVLNAWGSAPTTLTTFNNMVKTAFSADNSSSILSVSTFEKDTKAIQALAAKIGRTPSFKPKKSAAIPEELESVASDGTFEQDQKKRMRSQISPRMQQGGMVMNNPSEVSTSTFEKDMNLHQPKPHLSVIGEAASSRLGHSVSRQQSTAGGNMGGGVQTNNIASPQMMTHQAHVDAQVRTNGNSTQGWFGSSTNHQDTGVISVNTPVTSKSTGPSPYTQIMNNRGKQGTVAKQETATDGAKTTKLTKISPLAIELSPSTVDKGVKKKKAQSSGSLWDRFVCGI